MCGSGLGADALVHSAGPVMLSVAADGGGVMLVVRDHGSGFPDRCADRAFERFIRASEGRSGPGSGLGLAIVAVVAEAHGARRSAEDRRRPCRRR